MDGRKVNSHGSTTNTSLILFMPLLFSILIFQTMHKILEPYSTFKNTQFSLSIVITCVVLLSSHPVIKVLSINYLIQPSYNLGKKKYYSILNLQKGRV